MVSVKITFVSGSMARSKAETSSGSTKVTRIPRRGKMFENSAYVPP